MLLSSLFILFKTILSIPLGCVIATPLQPAESAFCRHDADGVCFGDSVFEIESNKGEERNRGHFPLYCKFKLSRKIDQYKSTIIATVSFYYVPSVHDAENITARPVYRTGYTS